MSLSAFHLDGKNALATGSHRGLGAAIALALAEAGANVASALRRAAAAQGQDETQSGQADQELARTGTPGS